MSAKSVNRSVAAVFTGIASSAFGIWQHSFITAVWMFALCFIAITLAIGWSEDA